MPYGYYTGVNNLCIGKPIVILSVAKNLVFAAIKRPFACGSGGQNNHYCKRLFLDNEYNFVERAMPLIKNKKTILGFI